MLTRQEINIVKAIRAMSDDQREYITRCLLSGQQRVKRIKRVYHAPLAYLIKKPSLKR